MHDQLKIGVSSCLLGEPVRYDGRSKRNGLVADRISRLFDFVPVCPEVEAGFSIPRPPVQLVADQETLRALGVRDPTLDVTESLKQFSTAKAEQLKELSGYIFKARSPSCGPDVLIHTMSGGEAGRGMGLFVCAMNDRYPLLPIIDEESIADSEQGGRFLLKALLYSQWQKMASCDRYVEQSPEIIPEIWHRWVAEIYSERCYFPLSPEELSGSVSKRSEIASLLRHLS